MRKRLYDRSKQGFVQLIPGELAPMEFGRIVDGIVDKGIKADTKAGKTIWEVERLPEEPVLGIGDDLAIYTPKNTPVSHLSMHDAIQYYRLARHVTDRLAKGPKVITLPAKPDRKSTTSELQSLMRISYAVFCLKKKNKKTQTDTKEIN